MDVRVCLFVGPLRAAHPRLAHSDTYPNYYFTTIEDWYISVATLVKGFDADPYFRMAEQEAWLPHGGKAHWGKIHFMGHVSTCVWECWGLETKGVSTLTQSHEPKHNPNTTRQNELRQLYGEPFDKFLAVRRRLDPIGMFLNDHLLTLFFPKASK